MKYEFNVTIDAEYFDNGKKSNKKMVLSRLRKAIREEFEFLAISTSAVSTDTKNKVKE